MKKCNQSLLIHVVASLFFMLVYDIWSPHCYVFLIFFYFIIPYWLVYNVPCTIIRLDTSENEKTKRTATGWEWNFLNRKWHSNSDVIMIVVVSWFVELKVLLYICFPYWIRINRLRKCKLVYLVAEVEGLWAFVWPVIVGNWNNSVCRFW